MQGDNTPGLSKGDNMTIDEHGNMIVRGVDLTTANASVKTDADSLSELVQQFNKSTSHWKRDQLLYEYYLGKGLSPSPTQPIIQHEQGVNW